MLVACSNYFERCLQYGLGGADFLCHPLFLSSPTACLAPGPAEKVDFDDSQSVDEPQDSRPVLRDRTTVRLSAMCCLQLMY